MWGGGGGGRERTPCMTWANISVSFHFNLNKIYFWLFGKVLNSVQFMWENCI